MQHCWSTTRNIGGCYMLRPFAHPVACCCVLLGVAAPSLKLFSQYVQPCFVPWSLKRSETMLDPFVQLFQQCWGHARALESLMGFIPPTTDCRSKHCREMLHPVCTPLPTHRLQLPTLLAYQCWKLLRPFARCLTLQKREVLYRMICSVRYHTCYWFRSI